MPPTGLKTLLGPYGGSFVQKERAKAKPGISKPNSIYSVAKDILCDTIPIALWN